MAVGSVLGSTLSDGFCSWDAAGGAGVVGVGVDWDGPGVDCGADGFDVLPRSRGVYSVVRLGAGAC